MESPRNPLVILAHAGIQVPLNLLNRLAHFAAPVMERFHQPVRTIHWSTRQPTPSHVGDGPVRGHRQAWRATVALLAALAVVLSAAGCDPLSVGDADRRTPVDADATSTPVEAEATPTPQARDEEVDRGPIATVCVRGSNATHPGWLLGDFVQWTPDGAAVLFTHGTQIYVVTADGSRVWQIVERPHPVHGERIGLIAPFALSPDGTELVYATCRYPDPYRAAQREAAGEPLDREDYRHELARVRVDGTQHQRLTTNRDFETDPVWSPDGTRIAFYFREDDKGYGFFFSRKPFGLYTMAPDGSDIVQLQSEAMALSVSPRWSPDSERLVYGRYESESEGQWELWLYTIPVAGGAPQRLTLAASGASWSPDGQRIAFAKADGDEVALYTIAADGTDAQRVTTITGWQSRDGELDPTRAWIPIVAWSPDGSKILYSCGRICVVTQDGTPVRQPTRPEDPAEPIAAWAPDGSRIATVDFGGPQPNRRHDPVVSTMAPDGSDVQVLVTPGAAGFPVAAQSGYADVGASQAACAAGFVVDAPADNPGLVRDCEVLLELRDGFFGSTLVN